MPTKRTLRQQLADARAQIRTLVDERDDARADLAARRWTNRLLSSDRAETVLALTRERDDAIRRLRATEDQLAAARRQLAVRPAAASELWDARRARMLAERARASLAEQLATVQAANDAMCREQVNRSGNLDRREVTR